MHGWKQPIPTNLDAIFGQDFLSQDIFIWALLHASNQEHMVSLNGKLIKLNRGQCYATITYLARRFNKNQKTIKKYLKVLNKIHNVMEHDIYPQGIVLTIKSYDQVIKMDYALYNDLDNLRVPTTKPILTNKSNKNNKNENNIYKAETFSRDEHPYSLDIENVLSYWNKLHGKNFKYSDVSQSNFVYWKKIYSIEEIKTAINNIPKHDFWKDKMTPTILFKQKNNKNEEVQFIQQLLNIQPEKIPLKPKPIYRDGNITYPYPVDGAIISNKAEIDEWEERYGKKGDKKE